MKKSCVQLFMTIGALTLLFACTTTIEKKINKTDLVEIGTLVSKKYGTTKAEFISRELNNEVSFYDSIFKLNPDMVIPTFQERIDSLSLKYDIKQKLNAAAKKKQEEATKKAEFSKGNISEIPLGFRFRMSKNDVSKLLKRLQNKNIISHNGYEYVYFYKTIKGEKIEFRLDFRYFENELKTLYFHLYGYTIGSDRKRYENEAIRALEIDLTEKLDSTYNKISYYETYDEVIVPITKWFKNNQIVTLKQYFGVYISYEDAPTTKIALDKEVQDILKKNNSTINQSWRMPRGTEYADIGKLIVKNNIKVCGEYYVKEETSGEYIIACSPDGIKWHYFVAYTKIGKFYRASDEIIAKLTPPR